MSTDRTTEILNYLSDISREVGVLRTEMNTRFSEVNTRLSEQSTHLDHIETEVARLGREQRLLNRIGSVMLETRADIEELQERVDTLEGK